MKAIVHAHFQAELSKAQTLIAKQDFASAWIALQRAHILGQNDAIAHTIAHWQMLKLAWKQRDFREIMGQLVSTILAIPLTLLSGNSRYLRGGKAHVQESEKMSIPEDIQQILNQ